MSTVTLGGKRRFYEIEVLIDANTSVKKGDHVGSYSSGNGFAKTITAATGIIPLGRAGETVDNTGGAAGDKSFMVDCGREIMGWLLKNDTVAPVGPTNLFGLVYWSAANTVSPDDDGASRTLAGRVWTIEADGKIVVEPLREV
jgi:hypothetical protein